MPTRKEILERKSEWIEALEDTIQKYQECIDTDEPYDGDIHLCALCKLGFNANFYPMCSNCIHLSSFSHNKQCFSQPSYYKSPKVRQRYLKNILKRIKDNS